VVRSIRPTHQGNGYDHSRNSILSFIYFLIAYITDNFQNHSFFLQILLCSLVNFRGRPVQIPEFGSNLNFDSQRQARFLESHIPGKKIPKTNFPENPGRLASKNIAPERTKESVPWHAPPHAYILKIVERTEVEVSVPLF